MDTCHQIDCTVNELDFNFVPDRQCPWILQWGMPSCNITGEVHRVELAPSDISYYVTHEEKPYIIKGLMISNDKLEGVLFNTTLEKSFSDKDEEEHYIILGLMKRNDKFVGLLSNTKLKKSFSLFCSTDEIEAVQYFENIRTIILPLAVACSSVFEKDIVQKVLDTHREHECWKTVHIAVEVGLHKNLESQLRNDTLNINEQTEMEKLSPLMIAVKGKNTDSVSKLLELGAKIDLEDREGNTVYHYAVLYDPEVIRLLAENDQSTGRDKIIDCKNKNGRTALWCACRNSKSESVALLLDAGANPNITDNDNIYPIFVALKEGDNKSVEHIYTKWRDQLFLRDNKYNGTLMHWAVNREMIIKLFEEGVSVNETCINGLTPLHVMQKKSRSECAFVLLCLEANANIGDEDGNTPLHFAAMSGDTEMLKILLVFDADVNIRNKKGESPLASTSNVKAKELLNTLEHHRRIGNLKWMKKTQDRLNLDHKNVKSTEQEDGGTLSSIGSQRESNVNSKNPTGRKNETQKSPNSCDNNDKSNGKEDPNNKKPSDPDPAKGLLDDISNSTELKNDLRLLSLDGGGIRGMVLCQILKEIEKKVRQPIKDCFDWIAGTSTGGILALAVCQGKTIYQIYLLYLSLKDEVFKDDLQTRSKKLEDILKKEFGENTVMANLKRPKTMVTGVLTDRHPVKLHLFRTYEEPPNSETDQRFQCPKSYKEQKVWEAARATSAAPSYFKSFENYIDGGLSANNPTLDLLTEFHRQNGHPKKSIGVVVSIGTGKTDFQKASNHDLDLSFTLSPYGWYCSIQGLRKMYKILLEQATIAEGRPVDTAEAWCGMIDVPFFRLNPLIEEVTLNEVDFEKIINMLHETRLYILKNMDRIKELAAYLRKPMKRARWSSPF